MSHDVRGIGARVLAALLLTLLCAGPGLAQAGEPKPEDPAAGVSAMLEALFEDVWSVASSSASGLQKRDAIASRLAAHLDYAALAQGALGERAERFSREEYAAFAHEYARYVTWLLVQRVADAERPAELVEARLAGPGVAQALALGRDRRKTFRFERDRPEGRSELRITLREGDGEWRVSGLRIDAIDVMQNFREQFAAVLERSEPEALIAELRRRNRENEDADPFA